MLRDNRQIIRRLTEAGFTLARISLSARYARFIVKQVGAAMHPPHFIALIHKEHGSGYGVSFPDVPGVVAMGDDLDEALAEARVALAFALEDWVGALPKPRSLEDLHRDERLLEDAKDAVVAAVLPHEHSTQAAE